MANSHWSQNAHTVKIFQVNALALIPFVAWLMRMTSLTMLGLFVLTVIYFIVVENFMKMRVQYLIPLIKYKIGGSTRKTKTRVSDI